MGFPVVRRLYQPGRASSLADCSASRGVGGGHPGVSGRGLRPALSILEELLAERGVFQCQIHFSSSQAIIWTIDDPLRYRILDQQALTDPDICLLYPSRPYPVDARIPRSEITRILNTMQGLRKVDMTIYLRTASINIYNGMVSLTFSCDGSHYMHYDEFLAKGASFWSGAAL